MLKTVNPFCSRVKNCDAVYDRLKKKERKSVELAGNRAEGWKELDQLFHQQASCYVTIVVGLFLLKSVRGMQAPN